LRRPTDSYAGRSIYNEKIMSEDLANLPVGSPLQLQAVGDAEAPRYQVRTIGYLPDHSLIVTTPEVNGKLAFVRAGQAYRVRMLRGDSVIGFQVEVLTAYNLPYPHMHLTYPKEVDRIVVRNARRVMSDIWGTVRNMEAGDDAEHMPAAIIDLSMTGAKLASDVPLGVRGDKLQLNFEISVVGKQEKIATLGIIRNTGEREGPAGMDEFTYGVEFSAINRYQKVLLHGWVLERMTSDEQPA
jgi:c-di-GMP-binding flagellar brake protein YcgR